MTKLLRYSIAAAGVAYIIFIATLIGSPETFDAIGKFLYLWILFGSFFIFFYIVDYITPTHKNNDSNNTTEGLDKE